MKSLMPVGFFVAAVVAMVVLAIAGEPAVRAEVAQPMADDPKPCVRKKFKTKLVANACKDGQKAARNAMKKFVKSVKKAKKAAGDAEFALTCTDCHAELNPKFPLKKGAVDRFKELGALVDTK